MRPSHGEGLNLLAELDSLFFPENLLNVQINDTQVISIRHHDPPGIRQPQKHCISEVETVPHCQKVRISISELY